MYHVATNTEAFKLYLHHSSFVSICGQRAGGETGKLEAQTLHEILSLAAIDLSISPRMPVSNADLLRSHFPLFDFPRWALLS